MAKVRLTQLMERPYEVFWLVAFSALQIISFNIACKTNDLGSINK